MKIFNQVTFNNRNTKRVVADWLQGYYWSISDLAKFLKQKGVALPVHITSYDFARDVARLRSASGRQYRLGFHKIGTECDNGISEFELIEKPSYISNIGQGYYGELWLTKYDETYRYQLGFSPVTYETGKIVKLEDDSTIYVTYGKTYCRYQLFTANRFARVMIEITESLSSGREGHVIMHNTKEIEEYLRDFDCINGPTSAEKIYKDISKISMVNLDKCDNVTIGCRAVKEIPKNDTVIVKMVRSCGKLVEFQAKEGPTAYIWKDDNYEYQSGKVNICYNARKEEYKVVGTWTRSTPVISTPKINDKISILKKRLGK